LNVFDIDALDSEHPVYANDFPNGAGRLKIGSRGYAATIVNGDVVTEHGTNTGNRPGRVLREFARG
ncbi:MAG: D-aminoacylase, partial [Acidimicrobiales bacterium]